MSHKRPQTAQIFLSPEFICQNTEDSWVAQQESETRKSVWFWCRKDGHLPSWIKVCLHRQVLQSAMDPKVTWNEFVENTTVHGVKYILSKNIVRRLGFECDKQILLSYFSDLTHCVFLLVFSSLCFVLFQIGVVCNCGNSNGIVNNTSCRENTVFSELQNKCRCWNCVCSRNWVSQCYCLQPQ